MWPMRQIYMINFQWNIFEVKVRANWEHWMENTCWIKHRCAYKLTCQRTGFNILFRRAHGFSEISGMFFGSWRGQGVRWYTVSSEISVVSLESFIHQNQFHSDLRRDLPLGWLADRWLTSRLRIFHTYGNIHHCGWMAAELDL